MKSKLFVVHDNKVGAYLPPMIFRTAGECLRAFVATCDDPSTMFSKWPADYTLFEVAEFDDETGCVEPYDCHVNLGKALDLKTPPRENGLKHVRENSNVISLVQ